MGLFSNKPLKGKVAIVTGGTRGIGLGIADKFASLGAKVVVCAIHPEKIKHTFIHADVSKAEDVMKVINFTISKFKKIDILVNNAGIYPNAMFKDMTEEQWDKVINVNLKGTFYFTKAVVPYMISNKSGKIINIASIAGLIGYAGSTHYCTTKAGLMGFTRALAVELAEHNINVNAIAPGLVITPGVQEGLNEQGLNEYIKTIPLKRPGLPKDIAEVAAFLAGEGSRNITGQTIVSDGGNVIE